MKVTFRKVNESDLKILNENVNNPDVCRFLCLIPPVSMKTTKDWYEQNRKNKNLSYCILVDGEIAGELDLMFKSKNSKQSHVASLGISIAKKYWGKGIGDEALKYALKKAQEKKIKRFELEYIQGNERAKKLYEKHGFKKEGFRKKAFKLGRRYVDAITMVKFLK